MLTVLSDKLCSVDGCDKKHHAKGYCKAHYHSIILPEYNWAGSQDKCSIEDCNNLVGAKGSKGLCCMHYSRLTRNGNANTVHRIRKYNSFDEIKEQQPDTYLDYVITDRSNWARICKKHYGDKCAICGWDETSCDVDHINNAAKGGQNTIRNGIVLCPNHHAMKHRVLRHP
jgi:predicted restriction endonuclease